MCLHCLGLAKLCPPDCFVKIDIKAPLCAAIFRLGIVMLQCVRTGEVFCGLHVAHVHIICPVRDVTHVRKCTRPSPAFPYCKRRKAGRGLGTRLQLSKEVTVKRIIVEYPESAPANFDDTFHVRIHKLCCVHLLHEVYRLCLSDLHPLLPSVCLSVSVWESFVYLCYCNPGPLLFYTLFILSGDNGR